MKLITTKNVLKNEDMQYIKRTAGHELAAEVKDICMKVGLDNINEKENSKEEIKEAVLYKNYLDMKADMERYNPIIRP